MRDDRFRNRREIRRAALVVRPAAEIVCTRQLVEQLAWVVGLESGDVAAGAERAAGASQHDDAHVVVGTGHVHGLVDLVRHDVRPGVQLLGTIERDRRDAVADVVQDLLVRHVRSPLDGRLGAQRWRSPRAE